MQFTGYWKHCGQLQQSEESAEIWPATRSGTRPAWRRTCWWRTGRSHSTHCWSDQVQIEKRIHLRMLRRTGQWRCRWTGSLSSEWNDKYPGESGEARTWEDAWEDPTADWTAAATWGCMARMICWTSSLLRLEEEEEERELCWLPTALAWDDVDENKDEDEEDEEEEDDEEEEEEERIDWARFIWDCQMVWEIPSISAVTSDCPSAACSASSLETRVSTDLTLLTFLLDNIPGQRLTVTLPIAVPEVSLLPAVLQGEVCSERDRLVTDRPAGDSTRTPCSTRRTEDSSPRGPGRRTWRGRRDNCRDLIQLPAVHSPLLQTPAGDSRQSSNTTSVISHLTSCSTCSTPIMCLHWWTWQQWSMVRSPDTNLATLTTVHVYQPLSICQLTSSKCQKSLISDLLFILIDILKCQQVKCKIKNWLKSSDGRTGDLWSLEFDQTGHNTGDKLSRSWVHIFSYHIPTILQHSSRTEKITHQIFSQVGEDCLEDRSSEWQTVLSSTTSYIPR